MDTGTIPSPSRYKTIRRKLNLFLSARYHLRRVTSDMGTFEQARAVVPCDLTLSYMASTMNRGIPAMKKSNPMTGWHSIKESPLRSSTQASDVPSDPRIDTVS